MLGQQVLVDQQAALSFMTQQASYIETEVYRIQYPEIQYPYLVPVDYTAPEWTKSITFFSLDHVGQAQWFHHMATDMRLADLSRQQFVQGVEMAAIGYRYTLEEIGQAMQLNIPLTTEKAAAAVRASEEFTDDVAMRGDAAKGMYGILNLPGVPIVVLPDAVAAGTDSKWSAKTPNEIMTDVNGLLTGVYVASKTVETANTLLLPIVQFTDISTRMINDNTAMTVLQWLTNNNAYTATTGQALTIRAVRSLAGAGVGGVDRMVAYRRDPSVLKMHVPMRHRFMPVWQTGPIFFDVPGIFRLGGVELRRPGAMRYGDGL